MRTVIGLFTGSFLAVVLTLSFLAILPERHTEALLVFAGVLLTCVAIAWRVHSVRAGATYLLGIDGIACLAASAAYVVFSRGQAFAHVGVAGVAAVMVFATFGAAFLLTAILIRPKEGVPLFHK